jgi:hypothetical protein
MAVRTRRDIVSHSIYTVTTTALETVARDRQKESSSTSRKGKEEQTIFLLFPIPQAEVMDNTRTAKVLRSLGNQRDVYSSFISITTIPFLLAVSKALVAHINRCHLNIYEVLCPSALSLSIMHNTQRGVFFQEH